MYIITCLTTATCPCRVIIVVLSRQKDVMNLLILVCALTTLRLETYPVVTVIIITMISLSEEFNRRVRTVVLKSLDVCVCDYCDCITNTVTL